MPRTKKPEPAQQSLLTAKTNTAPCVPKLRVVVTAWRDGGYKGVTVTTRQLLNYWFRTDHRLPNRRPFSYHYAQREAIETLIYLYEVVSVRSQTDLIEQFANRTDIRLL